ncbi:MAG: tRNA (adenosine(37)-N6)-dimethylallyltransferase MiaA [Mollicutes bacterium]|nr:tRNA (adenosine(37)-N6)-dimethylallyltransferase MiaA [Mollicutes bacterium]
MNKVIVIVGPTAIGKTKLSIELAKRLDGEIINADSTQIYKGLDIATAKITKDEMEGVPHHLIDIKEITEDYTVYHYQQDARKKIDEILKRKKIPIMVGGTGLYIKAALYDYQFYPETKKYNYEKYSNNELYQMLLEIDSNTKIHKNNRKRVERALDYYFNNQEALSQKKNSNQLLYDAIFIGLTTERKKLYERINKRVDEMMDMGLLEEAKKIYDLNIRTKAVMTPIGYKELFDYFDGNKTLEESILLIKQRSRNYAKRQYTWFNNQMEINWFETNFNDFAKTVSEVMDFLNQKLNE